MNATFSHKNLDFNRISTITGAAPLITIITATYNSAQCLPKAINSIRGQSYSNVEWIIVDGASQDGTVELLRNNEDIIDCWVSEPDSGIYEAWNKGVKMANGKFICFLGADDCWATNKSLEKLVNARHENEEIVSAKTAVVSGQGKMIRVFGEPWCKENMERQQVVAHPGMLFDAKLFDQYGLFDTSYAIAGDYEWLLRLNDDTRAVFHDEITVLMEEGGASEKDLVAVLTEMKRAQTQHVHSSWIKHNFFFMAYAIRIIIGKAYRLLISRPQ